MIDFSLVILAKTDNDDVFNMNTNCIHSFVRSAQRAHSTYEIILVESNQEAQYNYQVELLKIKPQGKFNFHKFGNIGLREAKGDYYVFSNNDVLYDENFLLEIKKVCAINKNIKSFSPYDKTSNSLPIPLVKQSQFILGYDLQRHLTGWCIVMHKSVFRTIKELDERFNFYYADNDYAMQLQKYNIKHALVTKALATHLEAKSTSKTSKNFEIPKDIPNYVVKENRTWILQNPNMIKGVIQFHKKWGSRRSIKLKLYLINKLKMIGLDHFSRFVLRAK